MKLFNIYSIDNNHLWTIDPVTGCCAYFGPKNKAYSGKLYFVDGNLYSNNNGDFSKIDQTTGKSKIIKKGGWENVSSVAMCMTTVYAIHNKCLVTVELKTGEMIPLGKDTWSSHTQLASIDGGLYGVSAGNFYKISIDGSRSELASNYGVNKSLTVVGSTLFALDNNNKLQLWTTNNDWKHLGNESWLDSGFIVGAGSLLYSVDRGSFWKVNTYTGKSTKVGTGNWTECSSCVVAPLSATSIKSPYNSSNSSTWIKGEHHTHVSGSSGRIAHGPNPNVKIENYDILKEMFMKKYEFIVATGHESFPCQNDLSWSVNSRPLQSDNSRNKKSEIPKYFTNGTKNMVVIAGMERQHKTLNPYDNISPEVCKKLVNAKIHTRYLENEDGSACCLHPAYYTTQYKPKSDSDLSELDILVTNQDITGGNKLLMDSLEVFNDYAAFEDQYPPEGKKKNGLAEGKVKGFAENFWDQVLLSGRNMWGYAGDCSFYAARDKGNNKEKGLQQGIQGRTGAGWVMLRIDNDYHSLGYPENKDQIVSALTSGKFYATTGVELSSIAVSGDTITVTAKKELNWKSIIGPDISFQPIDNAFQYMVRFPAGASYLRIECTDTSTSAEDRLNTFGHYPKAWTQAFWPIMN